MNFVNLQEKHSTFKYYQFDELLSSELIKQAAEESKRFAPFLIEKTRTSNPQRIWMNQMWMTIFSEIAEQFDSKDAKEMFSDTTGTDYRNMRTRPELCVDKKGSWLEPHVDDPAKELTLQLYLSGVGNSTTMGNAATQIQVGSGWFFVNTGTEWHRLSPLENDRTSIIINYVNEKWNDTTVLV
jgi:hypothetical protein